MTDLQKSELSILIEFIRICNELELKYYLVCGSVLGAVKYGGFIPWDDDVDVALARNEYEIFLEEAKKTLSADFCIENSMVDKNCPFIFTKLCKKDTTYIEIARNKIEMSHFLGIDVFPIDGYPLGKYKASFFELKKKHYERRRWINNTKSNRPTTHREIISNAISHIYKIMFPNVKKSNYKYNRLLKENKLDNSELWCNHGNSSSKKEYAPKEQYGEGTWATFEGLMVRIPEKYDEYLTQKYGDWRADLPPEEQYGHHFAEVIDLTRPYTDYIVKVKKGKIRLKTSEELLQGGIIPPKDYRY